MKPFLLILPMFLAAGTCQPAIEYVEVKPEIPAQLMEPTPISKRQAVTYRDLAILATEHLQSARQANADKAAIKEILEGADS
ncbi:hypothetical protein O4H61_03250 [Roseovarius aestuarii]|nr:hypothetical protein [Roseovarius aestuarii]